MDVARDLFNPTFANLDNTVQVAEVSAVGSPVFRATVSDQDVQVGDFACHLLDIVMSRTNFLRTFCLDFYS